MELFTIQCTTCRVRLKVKDESAIGDILACPKCGSMVQVVPPVGWKRAGDAAAPAVAAVSVTTPQVAPSLTPAPTPFAATAAVPPALPPRPAAPSAVSAIAPAPPAIEAVAPPPITEAAHASWIQTVVARVQADWPLLTSGLGAGALLGTVLWLVVAGSAPEAENVAQSSPPATVAALQSPLERSSKVDEAPDSLSATGVAELPVTAAPDRASQPTAAAIEPPTDEAPADDTAPPTVDDKPVIADVPAAAPAVAPVLKPKPAIKLDPVDHPPAAKDPLDLADVSPSAADQPPTGDEPDGAPAGGGARTPADHPTAAPAASKPSLSQAEVDERLSVPLPRVKFVKVPLAQFVEFVGGVAGLDISIDERALAAVGKKRQTPVTVQLSNTTADDALRAAVEPLGLACILRDGKLVVAVAPSRAAAK